MLPARGVVRQPLLRLPGAAGIGAKKMLAAATVAANEPGALQNAKMPGNRRERNAKWLGQLSDAHFTTAG